MTHQKLLHVLGGGPWQVPTIRRARELGHRVLVTDFHAERPGFTIADAFEVMDITDAEGTLEVSRRHGIDGILCDTTDTGVRTAAYVAECLGLPGSGLRAARACTDKAELRRAAQACGLTGPEFRVLSRGQRPEAAGAEIGYPLVVKPVDNQSGRGVQIVTEPSRLEAAFALALEHSRSGQALLESHITGVEHIIDGFLVDGNVEILGIASKQPYSDNPTIASRILYLTGEAFDVVCNAVAPGLARLLAKLRLRDGIFHAEVILQEDRIVPIDLAARGGGVMIYTHVLPAVSGVDAVSAMIARALGQPVRVSPQFRRSACIEFLRTPVGEIASISGQEVALAQPGVVGLHFAVGPGDAVSSFGKKDDRPGFVVGIGFDEQLALASVARARDVLAVRMVGDTRPRPFA